MSRTTPAEYWNEGNDLLAEARLRMVDGDHVAVGPLCSLAQANFAAAATRSAILVAEQAMPLANVAERPLDVGDAVAYQHGAWGRIEGMVTGVSDDGHITGEFAQEGSTPMTIRGPADAFIRVRETRAAGTDG